MKSSSNDRIDVGFVLRAHGVRGVVRVRAKADLGAVDALWLDDERFVVRHASRDKDEWLVTLDGVATREASEALRGRKVSLPRDFEAGILAAAMLSDLAASRQRSSRLTFAIKLFVS